MTKIENKKIILQVIPAMEMGGAEIGTVEISTYMKKKGWKVIIASSGGSLVNKFKVKIVHVRSRAPAWSAYYACSMIRGVKLVSTIHGAYSNQNIFKNFYNSVMLNSVKIIAISKYIKNYLLQNYNLTKKKRDKIVVIPRGVDPTKFSPQNIVSKRLFFLTNHWELPDGVPIILFPSRIAPFKGHKTLLKALAILKKETKIKFICLMVGLSKKNSNYDAEIKSFIDENDPSDYIKFTGACSDMPAAYKISDIVVSPADKPEGFGRIIIESQSMERPVIASAHGGSLELIKNNFSGILFKPKNERDLADKLKYLICLSREKKEKIIMNANALVSEKYDIEKMYDSNFKLYSSLIK